MDYIAREAVSGFLRPAFTCELTMTEVEQKDGFKKIAMSAVYRNQIGKEVLVGTSHGIIRN